MKVLFTPMVLLLFLVAGCEIEKDPVEEPLDPSLHLTDGFCLVKDSRVVLNHYDIDYYDYSAHMIYLKDPGAFEEKFKAMGPAVVYADSSRIYDLSFVSRVSSYFPQGPVLWLPFWCYADDLVNINFRWSNESMAEGAADTREDPRIVEALKKYGQFRHGLQAEILSVQYNSQDDVVLELELRNEDPVNYYYLDPEKLGLARYHDVSRGLRLWDADVNLTYTCQIEYGPPGYWDSMDLEGMSLLKSDSTVRLTFAYDRFDTVPPGTYLALFEFATPTFIVDHGNLEQPDGLIWLGGKHLFREMVVE